MDVSESGADESGAVFQDAIEITSACECTRRAAMSGGCFCVHQVIAGWIPHDQMHDLLRANLRFDHEMTNDDPGSTRTKSMK